MDLWKTPMGEIVCTDVTKVWGADTPREVVALDTVSLRVQPGEFLVVIGPSGCGKSTSNSRRATEPSNHADLPGGFS